MLLLVDPDADNQGEIFNFEKEPLQGLPDREGILYRAAMYHETFCLKDPEKHRTFNPANDKASKHWLSALAQSLAQCVHWLKSCSLWHCMLCTVLSLLLVLWKHCQSDTRHMPCRADTVVVHADISPTD